MLEPKHDKVLHLKSRILNFASVLLRGPRIATLSLDDVDQESLAFVEPTVVLSTGRCGTKWLTELLCKDARLRVNHSDYPELLRESRLAYEGYAEDPRLFHEILRATRDGYLLDSHRRGQRYVETNPRITFFAYAVREVYPKARFVHLSRHPGDFVRSGIRRNWYTGTYYDQSRPRMQDQEKWDRLTPIEKIAWLWNETNQYIEDFLASRESPVDCIQVKCEEMFGDVHVAARLCEFVGADVSMGDIESMHRRRVNRQRTGSMRSYDSWSYEEREQLRRFAKLAERFGYET